MYSRLDSLSATLYWVWVSSPIWFPSLSEQTAASLSAFHLPDQLIHPQGHHPVVHHLQTLMEWPSPSFQTVDHQVQEIFLQGELNALLNHSLLEDTAGPWSPSSSSPHIWLPAPPGCSGVLVARV